MSGNNKNNNFHNNTIASGDYDLRPICLLFPRENKEIEDCEIQFEGCIIKPTLFFGDRNNRLDAIITGET